MGWLTDSMFVYVRPSFFYSCCCNSPFPWFSSNLSLFILFYLSIYVNAVSYVLFGVSILRAWNICFDLISNINWLNDLTNNISSLIWSYQQYQFIKYCQKIVKKVRDTSPATNIAFSSIFLRKETRNINDSRRQISMPNFVIFARKRILILLIMIILMKVI